MGQEIGVTQGIYYFLLIALIGGSVIVSYRGKMGEAMKHLVIWLCIGFVVFVGVVYLEGMDGFKTKMSGALFPSTPQVNEKGDIVLNKMENGHFYLNAHIGGEKILFMVDTGASEVVLSKKDARKLDIDVDRLSFDKMVSTANGMGRAASYRLDELEVGGVIFSDIRASINGGEMRNSLLGMSFLEKLTSFTVQGNQLVMTP